MAKTPVKVHPTIIIGFTAEEREGINRDLLILRPDLADDPEGIEQALAAIARKAMIERLDEAVDEHEARQQDEERNRQRAERGAAKAALRTVADPLAPPPVFDGLLVESSP